MSPRGVVPASQAAGDDVPVDNGIGRRHSVGNRQYAGGRRRAQRCTAAVDAAVIVRRDATYRWLAQVCTRGRSAVPLRIKAKLRLKRPPLPPLSHNNGLKGYYFIFPSSFTRAHFIYLFTFFSLFFYTFLSLSPLARFLPPQRGLT